MQVKQERLNSKALGARAEELALSYFISKNYRCIAKNFLIRAGELDLVLLDQNLSPNEIVFCEVRSSQKRSWQLKNSISFKKKKALRRSAQVFLQKNSRFQGTPFRFDLLWVEAQSFDHWANVDF